MTTIRVKIRCCVIGLGLAAILGCGADDGIGRRYAVSGIVTYNDVPLEKGNIQFLPVDATGRAASGVIADGRYSLTTLDPDDGALPGRYKVSVIAKEVDLSRVTLDLKGQRSMTEAQKKRFTAENPQLAALQANKKAKDLVPPKYSSPETSGITHEVKEGSNQINIELKDG
jgi:hypothetical protein